MHITIKPAKKGDLQTYTDLLQKTYEATYTNDKLGLTKECFSKEIFHSSDTQNYLLSNLVNDDKQKCWLAFLGPQLVGAITIKAKERECQLIGFYVDPEYQGQGIGKTL